MPALRPLSRFTLPLVAVSLIAIAPSAKADNLGASQTPCCLSTGSLINRVQFLTDISREQPLFTFTETGIERTSFVTLMEPGNDALTANIMEIASSNGTSRNPQAVLEEDSLAFDPVPEPAPYLLLGTGLLALAGIIQKRGSSKP